MADLAALEGQYGRAIEAYEQVAIASLNSNLTKWSVKDYYLKAGACHLANRVCPLKCSSKGQDPIATKQAIGRYVEQDPTFASTRECILLQVSTSFTWLTLGLERGRR